MKNASLNQHPLEQRTALAHADAQQPGYVLAVGEALPFQIAQDSFLLLLWRHHVFRQVVAGPHLSQPPPAHQLLEPIVSGGAGNVQQGHHLVPGSPALLSDLGENLPLSSRAQGAVHPQVPEGQVIQPGPDQCRTDQLGQAGPVIGLAASRGGQDGALPVSLPGQIL